MVDLSAVHNQVSLYHSKQEHDIALKKLQLETPYDKKISVLHIMVKEAAVLVLQCVHQACGMFYIF
jgi:hypothetical protein